MPGELIPYRAKTCADEQTSEDPCSSSLYGGSRKDAAPLNLRCVVPVVAGPMFPGL